MSNFIPFSPFITPSSGEKPQRDAIPEENFHAAGNGALRYGFSSLYSHRFGEITRHIHILPLVDGYIV